MVRRPPATRLARWQLWLLGLGGGGLWVTGAAWLLLHYFGQTPGEFGPQMNPLEPWMMKAHGLAMTAALLALGGLLVIHIPKGWSHRRQRPAGLALSTLVGILILSGYLLYYLGGEQPRAWTSAAHWIVGLALPAAVAWHYVNGRRLRRRR